MRIFDGPVDAHAMQNEWLANHSGGEWGAFLTFIGIVRSEGGISALSFDIYPPMLDAWFESWQKKASEIGAILKMAHSKGDVPVGTSSFACAVLTPHRKAGLKLLNDFVEDFKANAPIWKYDVMEGKRVYALERSHALPNSGLLA